MYTFIYVYTYIYVGVHMFIRTQHSRPRGEVVWSTAASRRAEYRDTEHLAQDVGATLHRYIYIYTHIYIYAYMYMHIYIYISMYIYIQVYVYTCTYILCVYVYIYNEQYLHRSKAFIISVLGHYRASRASTPGLDRGHQGPPSVAASGGSWDLEPAQGET